MTRSALIRELAWYPFAAAPVLYHVIAGLAAIWTGEVTFNG
jgi:hypothetical protein